MADIVGPRQPGFIDEWMAEKRKGHLQVGFSVEKIGFGKRPAILVIDLQKGQVDKDSVFKGSPAMDRAVRNTKILLEEARKKKVPIFYTVIAYRDDLEDAPLGFRFKIRSLIDSLTYGSRWMEVCDEVEIGEGDILIIKKSQSAFFGTDLISHLVRLGVDTVIVTGMATTGCVRATVNDAFSYGFRTIVPEECVADYDLEGHMSNLCDMQGLLADVVTLKETLDYVAKL